VESIEGVSSESFEGVLEEANESEASRVIASARNALEKGEFETVVDLLRLMLEQSPLGEIHTNYSSEFFSILTDLFQINRSTSSISSASPILPSSSEPRPEGRGIVGRGFVSPQSFGFKLPRHKGRGLLFLDKHHPNFTAERAQWREVKNLTTKRRRENFVRSPF